ncbi:hypothetical protein Tco_1430234 [Tanacetum coccineum]
MGCCGKLMMRVGPLVLSLDEKLLGPRRMTKKINVHPEWKILQTLTNGAKRKLDHLLLHLRVDFRYSRLAVVAASWLPLQWTTLKLLFSILPFTFFILEGEEIFQSAAVAAGQLADVAAGRLSLQWVGVGLILGRSGTLVGQRSAYNRVLRTWACLADFRLSCGSILWKLSVRLAVSGPKDLLSFILNCPYPTTGEVGECSLLKTNMVVRYTALDVLFTVQLSCHDERRAGCKCDMLFDEEVGVLMVTKAVQVILQVSGAWLLAGAVQNAEVRGEPIPTLPFVTSSISATPEYEDEAHTDSAIGLNLRTIGAPPRFVISLDSSHHSGANIAEAEVDSFARPSVPLMTVATTITSIVDPATTVKEKFVESFVFCGDSSDGGADHTAGGFSDLTSSDFIVGGIRTVISPDTDLQKVYVPQWSITNGSRLDDGRTCREMVDEYAPPKFFASIHGMEHDQLFTEFNVRAARQMSLSAEVRMRGEYNIRERRRLSSTVEEKNSLLKARDEELESLKEPLLVKEAEAAEAIRLRAEASKFEVAKRYLRDEMKVPKEQNATLEQEKIDLSVKVADLAASVKVREQEVADLDAQVTFVKSQSDNFADQVHELEASSAGLQEKVMAYEGFIDQLEKFQDEKMKEVNEKFVKLCVDFVEMALHLKEKFYPRLLTTISGRRWLLTHDMELAIAKCLNSTEYLFTLGAAIGKDVEKGMQEGLSAGITHGTEGRKLTKVAAYNLSAEADYLSSLQRLQIVNFSLIAELRANKDASIDTIMNLLRLEDILAERLALRGGFVPLSEPLSAMALEGIEGTFGGALGTADTTTTLSIATADGNVADKDVNPFPNVDDAELNVSE